MCIFYKLYDQFMIQNLGDYFRSRDGLHLRMVYAFLSLIFTCASSPLIAAALKANERIQQNWWNSGNS